MKKFCIVVVVCALSLAAYADEMGGGEPGINISWGEVGMGMGNTWMDGMDGTSFQPNGDDSISLHAGSAEEPLQLMGCELDLTMTYDPDPFVNAAFGVKNTLNVDQMFTFTFAAPVVPPLAPSSEYFGTTGGSVTAEGDPGSLSTAMGTAFYQGFIDGGLILELHEPLMVPVTSGTVNIPVDQTPGFLPGPAVNSEIKMTYTFILTPGESASITGAFVVNEIPEPATLAILGLGAVLIRARKR